MKRAQPTARAPVPVAPVAGSQLTAEQTRAVLSDTVHWNVAQHRKALKERADARREGNGVRAANRKVAAAVNAIARSRPASGYEAARQLLEMVQNAPRGKLVPDSFDLHSFALLLRSLTDFLQPKKPPLKLETARGRLTKDGVLFRYHAFLAAELLNVSIQLYGCGRYAFHMIPFDSFVNRALGDPPGWRNAIRTLSPRALKVMRSLRIDTTRPDIRARKAVRS